MTLSKEKKENTHISSASYKDARQRQATIIAKRKKSSEKSRQIGRPSPRTGNTIRQTLLLSEEVAKRFTLAFEAEQVKRRIIGEKIDKSSLIEEIIVMWLEINSY